MINILSSNAALPSSFFNKVKREGNENNIDWIRRNISSDGDPAMLVMVGGKTPTDLRLRFAQSHVRSDLAPSNWSHVMLLGKTHDDLARATVTEVSLEPLRGFKFPPPENGVQEGELNRYRSPKKYPNIAVLHVPVRREEIDKALHRFKMQRAVLDAVDLILRWLAYVWGVGRASNPLLDGLGIPAAAMLEIVVGTAGFDLTPGLESRSSCPEAISQAAKYWHQYYQQQEKMALWGAYWAPHQIQPEKWQPPNPYLEK